MNQASLFNLDEVEKNVKPVLGGEGKTLPSLKAARQPEWAFLFREGGPVGSEGLRNGPGGLGASDKGASGRPFPYPCKKESITSHVFSLQNLRMSFQKKTCQSVWCPGCFKRGSLKKILRRLKAFDWERTRHVVFTLNPSLFSGGEEGYKTVSEGRILANLIWNLKRTKGIKVWDWLWIMEFHGNGFPHWHAFIEVEKKGGSGMIGGDVLRRYWGVGRVMENRVFSKDHWKKITGYFEGHGYFGEGKEHQLALPEWGLKMNRRIRKWGAMVLDKVDEDFKLKKENLYKGSGKERVMREYKVILAMCGSQTRVIVRGEGVSVDKVVDVPYWELRKKCPGEYLEAVGYICNMDYVDLTLLAEMYDGFVVVLGAVIADLEFWEGWDVKKGVERR